MPRLALLALPSTNRVYRAAAPDFGARESRTRGGTQQARLNPGYIDRGLRSIQPNATSTIAPFPIETSDERALRATRWR